ncbi:hypothetical protein AB0F65_02460 [Nocardia rhamnosiphila]|uniref:hypothetical protein n=1 Tax=Nocardia rhamnosiphila TaxID=426716 RepID=UPI0033FEB325
MQHTDEKFHAGPASDGDVDAGCPDERLDARKRIDAPAAALPDHRLPRDVVAALIYWRMVVRQAPAEPHHLDHVTDSALRATGRETRET